MITEDDRITWDSEPTPLPTRRNRFEPRTLGAWLSMHLTPAELQVLALQLLHYRSPAGKRVLSKPLDELLR